MFSPASVAGCFALSVVLPRALFSLFVRRVRLSLDYTGSADFAEEGQKSSQSDLDVSFFL